MVQNKEKISIIIVIFLVIILVGYNLSSNPNKDSTSTEEKTSKNITTSVYSSDGVSFQYPSSWNINKELNGNDTIISGYIENFSLFNIAPFNLQISPNYGMSDDDFKEQMQNTANGNGLTDIWSKVSNSTIEIAGKSAYLEIFNVYSIWPPIWNHKVETITFTKNNYTYSIILEAPQDEFSKDGFDIILNSFKVE